MYNYLIDHVTISLPPVIGDIRGGRSQKTTREVIIPIDNCTYY